MATTIGEALRAARKKRGLSLRDLEKMTKMSSSQISQVETGVRVDPAFGTVIKLARAIAVSIDELLDIEGDVATNDAMLELERMHSETLRSLRRLESVIDVMKHPVSPTKGRK